jgi:hypothetical protein
MLRELRLRTTVHKYLEESALAFFFLLSPVLDLRQYKRIERTLGTFFFCLRDNCSSATQLSKITKMYHTIVTT